MNENSLNVQRRKRSKLGEEKDGILWESPKPSHPGVDVYMNTGSLAHPIHGLSEEPGKREVQYLKG